MKHLFLMGNKRSGTSLLGRVLSLHPAVFVAPEADVAWILYCLSTGQPPTPYPNDGPRGLERTMEAYGDLVQRPFTDLAARGDELLKALAEACSRNFGALAWVGDKKPEQHADPRVFDLLCKLYPDAHFIHIVRHPAAFARSVEKRIEFTRPGALLPDRAATYARWVRTEKWVLEHKAAGRAPIQSVSYEDLMQAPAKTASEIFKFLELDVSCQTEQQIVFAIDPNRESRHGEPPPSDVPDDALTIAAHYNSQ